MAHVAHLTRARGLICSTVVCVRKGPQKMQQVHPVKADGFAANHVSTRLVVVPQVDDLPGDFMAVSDPDTRPLVTAKLELEDEMQTKSANIQEALPMVALANSTPGSHMAMKVRHLVGPTPSVDQQKTHELCVVC